MTRCSAELTTERYVAVLPADVRVRRVTPRPRRVPRIRVAAEVDGQRGAGVGEVVVRVGVGVRLLRVPALTRTSGRGSRDGASVVRPGLGRPTACHVSSTVTRGPPRFTLLYRLLTYDCVSTMYSTSCVQMPLNRLFYSRSKCN